ncbi:MAG: hypothetical protein ACYTFY_15960 [Planctomycetota bacterium]|jgi:hypothetical protein
MLKSVEYKGLITNSTNLPGETGEDHVRPNNPCALQISKDRFMLFFSTMSYYGIDDVLSAVYQIRKDSISGPVVKEGFLRKRQDNWDLGDLWPGFKAVRSFSHVKGFGVPLGAKIKGKTPVNENVFAVRWYSYPRLYNIEEGYFKTVPQLSGWVGYHQSLEWCQFKFNAEKDDIEIIQEPETLRQLGYEDSEYYSSVEERGMNHGFTVYPYNEERTEWVAMHHHYMKLISPAKFRFNEKKGLYEWVESGPAIGNFTCGHNEANIMPYKDSWIVCSRIIGGKYLMEKQPFAFYRIDDPFTEKAGDPVFSEIKTTAPLTMYKCADGILRVMSSGGTRSPYTRGRNPLFSWELDPDNNFSLNGEQVLLDIAKEDISIDDEGGRMAHFCTAVNHTGGDTQDFIYSVRSCCLLNNDPAVGFRPMQPGYEEACGVYYSQMKYDQDYPAFWDFD